MRTHRPSPLGWLLGSAVVVAAVVVSVLDVPGMDTWWAYWLFAVLAIAALVVGTLISERAP